MCEYRIIIPLVLVTIVTISFVYKWKEARSIYQRWINLSQSDSSKISNYNYEDNYNHWGAVGVFITHADIKAHIIIMEIKVIMCRM